MRLNGPRFLEVRIGFIRNTQVILGTQGRGWVLVRLEMGIITRNRHKEPGG